MIRLTCCAVFCRSVAISYRQILHDHTLSVSWSVTSRDSGDGVDPNGANTWKPINQIDLAAIETFLFNDAPIVYPLVRLSAEPCGSQKCRLAPLKNTIVLGGHVPVFDHEFMPMLCLATEKLINASVSSLKASVSP
jgi:hypothetical protein